MTSPSRRASQNCKSPALKKGLKVHVQPKKVARDAKGRNSTHADGAAGAERSKKTDVFCFPFCGLCRLKAEGGGFEGSFEGGRRGEGRGEGERASKGGFKGGVGYLKGRLLKGRLRSPLAPPLPPSSPRRLTKPPVAHLP